MGPPGGEELIHAGRQMDIIIIIIYLSVMELGHLLARSGLKYPEVSSKVCHDSFCQMGNCVSLPWVIYHEAFCLHVVSSFSCIPVICPEAKVSSPTTGLTLLWARNLFRGNFNHRQVSREEAGQTDVLEFTSRFSKLNANGRTKMKPLPVA
jgi:hypothetical protein